MDADDKRLQQQEASGLAEIKSLLQEQHDRFLNCLQECVSSHEEILSKILAQEECMMCASKLESQPIGSTDGIDLKLSNDFATEAQVVSPNMETGNDSDKLQAVAPLRNSTASEKQNGNSEAHRLFHSSVEEELAHVDAALKQEAMDLERAASTTMSFREPKRVSKCRARVKRLVASSMFEALMSVAILTNSILIGVETQYLADHRGVVAPFAFTVAGWAHSLVYLVEAFLRFYDEGFPDYFKCRWNCFDITLVGFSLMEFFLDLLTIDKDVQHANILRTSRMVRFLRLSRIFRIARLVRVLTALHMMIESIVGTMQSLMWVLVLMFFIVYIFGIVFTQATTGHLTDRPGEGDVSKLLEFWGGLGPSMFTLYKSVTGGISWHEVVVPLNDMGMVWLWLFLVYVSFTYFAVLNAVTGVFCNSAIENAKREPEMLIDTLLLDESWYEKSFQKLFGTVDTTGSGTIGIGQLETSLEDPLVRAWFAAMGLETRDAWTLFKLIDSDRSNDVSVHEFVERCMALRGNARSIDLEQLRQEHKLMARKVLQLASKMETVLTTDHSEHHHHVANQLAHISRLVQSHSSHSRVSLRHPPHLKESHLDIVSL